MAEPKPFEHTTGGGAFKLLGRRQSSLQPEVSQRRETTIREPVEIGAASVPVPPMVSELLQPYRPVRL